MSVIGEQINARGELKEHITTRGYKVALMREGYYHTHDFLMADLKDFRFNLNLIRLFFAVMVLISLGVYARLAKIEEAQALWVLITSSIITLAIINGIWISLYFFTKSVLIWSTVLVVAAFAAKDYSIGVLL